jgi:hypothetical protein
MFKFLKSLINWFLSTGWKSIIVSALDKVDPTQFVDVDAYKGALCDWIQDQHKVPGDIRGFACNEIKKISAASILALIDKLKGAVK